MYARQNLQSSEILSKYEYQHLNSTAMTCRSIGSTGAPATLDETIVDHTVNHKGSKNKGCVFFPKYHFSSR